MISAGENSFQTQQDEKLRDDRINVGIVMTITGSVVGGLLNLDNPISFICGVVAGGALALFIPPALVKGIAYTYEYIGFIQSA